MQGLYLTGRTDQESKPAGKYLFLIIESDIGYLLKTRYVKIVIEKNQYFFLIQNTQVNNNNKNLKICQ